MNNSAVYNGYEDLIGQEIGLSDWILVDQSRIDDFAAVTEDRQFIHTDPIAAKATPFGGTIAHGFLTLSLLSRMALDFGFGLKNSSMVVNYGFEKIRFIDAVRSGSKLRGRFVLTEATERAPGQIMVRFAVTVEVEGQAKPALVADWLTLQFLNSAELQQGAA
jgi:acyl dehydratase